MPPVFWVQKQDIGPSPRAWHGLAYDPARGRVVVFGGDAGGPPLGDTWEWDGSLWTQATDIGPQPRHSFSLTHHAASQRLVLFGGGAGAAIHGDTWTWDGTDWTQVADTGPQARRGHAAAYDPTRQRTVLFGGTGPLLGDTWEWNGTEWTQIQDAGPSPRQGHSMGFDLGRGQVVLFGGADVDGTGLDDTWAWDGSSWTQILDTGPEPRAWAAMAGTGSILLFGGVNSIDPALATANRVMYADTWQLTAQGWTRVQDIGPAARIGHGAVSKASPAPPRTVLFGGTTVFGGAGDSSIAAGIQNDTWEVPDVAAGGQPQPQGIYVTRIDVQPDPVPLSTPAGFVVTVRVTTNLPLPSSTYPVLIVGSAGYPVASGFNQIPPVFSPGTSNVLTFTITRDGSQPPPGKYGVQIKLPGQIPFVGPFQVV